MVGIDHADHVIKDGRLSFDQTVGGQAAHAFTDAHGPARRVKAQANLCRGSNGVIEPRAIGEQIQVVRGQGATRQRQFRKANLG